MNAKLADQPTRQRTLTQLDGDELHHRSLAALSAKPRPFLRWAGSKRALLPRIVEALPASYRAYHEPFLGAGSLFFLLQPRRAFISDSCAELIETFDAVRENPDAVLRYLRSWKPDREVFYAIRAQRSKGRFKRAAEFIYLNKTCWNGLYRVNSRGAFNVPYGRPKTDHIVDEENLIVCAAALANGEVKLRCSDFEAALSDIHRHDLVFLDPPYVTRHNNNGFIDYNEQLFSWDDQVRLAAAARDLAARGAHVLVTNAFHNDVVDLYDGFNVVTLDRSSTLASSASKRSRVTEALFWLHGGKPQIG